MLLWVTVFLVAGQTLLIALYCFLFAPMFFHGVGPDEDYEQSGAATRIVVAMVFGVLAVATNVWSCSGTVHALRNQVPAARRLLAAGTVQAVVVICALIVAWLPAVVASVAVLVPLLLCYALDRRAFS
ncbi:hypothetical protein [Streptomyces klenkii]|uniref:hypothetical protein n=1 Tax=Streptomyces klenkii TaxID=1420899 RepID=UPI00341E80D3